MQEREKSIFSVIDVTPSQYYRPLQLWELAAVELWERYNNENSKYKKIELYRFINYFPIEEFKSKFYNEFEIYKELYHNGTIETFRKKEYQQFIYDCEDIIEMIDTQTHYALERERGFDFYFQQMKGWKKGYILEKNDIHIHEINIKALLQFLQVDCLIETNKKSNPHITTIKDKKYSFDSTLNNHQINYLYTNYFSIHFDCSLNDIENLFSDNVSKQITINKNIQLIDIIYFFYELVEAKIITAKQWQNVFDKTNCLIFNNSPVTSSKIKDTVKRIKKSTRDNNTINIVESLISYIIK